MKKKRNIAASEIRQWCFCPRQWCFCPRQWYLLRTTGLRIMTPAGKRGFAYHQREAVRVNAVVRSQSALTIILLLGGAACCIWLWF